MFSLLGPKSPLHSCFKLEFLLLTSLKPSKEKVDSFNITLSYITASVSLQSVLLLVNYV